MSTSPKNIFAPVLFLLSIPVRNQAAHHYNPIPQNDITDSLKEDSEVFHYCRFQWFYLEHILIRRQRTTELNFAESSQKTDCQESQTVNIVHYFLQTLSKTGHVLFMDKYYGGLNVMEEVLNAKQHGVVACQNNRPSDLFSECLAAGKYFHLFDN